MKTITCQTKVIRSARVMQMEGIFDVPETEISQVEINVGVELPDEWNIGLIVGPSGCGKTTVAKHLWPDELIAGFDWDPDRAIVDGFPKALGIKDITDLLNRVGFSSPPAWIRPYNVLSNGEQFRVTMARALAELPDLAVMDEFTSVVGRTVAKIGSRAIAKAVRARGQKLIAVSCHYDIEAWLEPDWVFEPHLGKTSRRSVRRDCIEFQLRRVHHSAWDIFKNHHYLTSTLNKASACYMLVEKGGGPVGFMAVLPFPHKHRPGWRLSRIVILPDFQGAGIGNRMNEYVAGCYRSTGKPVFATMSHPSLVGHCARSPLWDMRRTPSLTAKPGKGSMIAWQPGQKKSYLERTGKTAQRLTAGMEYIGPVYPEDAAAFGIGKPLSRSATQAAFRIPRLRRKRASKPSR